MRTFALAFRTIVVALVVVLLLVISGVLPFAAAPAFAPGERIRHFATRQSIRLRARSVDAPRLDNPSLVMRGAGHFETACRRCHGIPGAERPLLLRNMLPTPPNLVDAADRYSPSQLFEIVKHGIRGSGMPAWPVLDRDDEVWAMVAFISALPHMNAGGYMRLTFPPEQQTGTRPDVPAVVRAVCGRCHGIDGLGRGAGAFPVLAGQQARYLYLALRAFSYSERQSGIMMPVAAELTDAEMQEVSAYYSSLPGLAVQPVADAALHEAQAIVSTGIPRRLVPSCAPCHAGNEPRNAAYPILAGQYADYLALQLTLFAERRRGGSMFAHLMHQPADGLTGTERDLVARYFGTQPRTSAGGSP
jgi:cytochrome c553